MSALVELTALGARTTSRIIAEAFDRPHKDVLASIDKIVESRPVLRGRNFSPTEETVKVGAAPRVMRYYEMDRDGFTLVAMGFTGEKALDWKLAFIEAFNRMEAALTDEAVQIEGDAPKRVSEIDLMEVGPALAVVREARQLFGRSAARRLWTRVGLPDPLVTQSADTAVVDRLVDGGTVAESVREWLAVRTRAAPGAKIRSMELYRDYERWAQDTGQRVEAITKWGRDLCRLGVVSFKSGPVWRTGIELID